MKKLFITTAIAFTALAFTSAQEATTTNSAPPMPPRGVLKMDARATTTLNGKDGARGQQVKALRMEMEAKIKAIRLEYDLKIRAIMGDTNREGERKERMDDQSQRSQDMNRSQDMEKDTNEGKKGNIREGLRKLIPGSGRPVSDLFNVFKGYFGTTVEAEQH